MLYSYAGIHAWWLEMVQNYLHQLINKYLKKNLFSYNIYKKGRVKRGISKSKIVYIMVLIEFKYKLAMATQLCQWKYIYIFF